MKQLFVILFLLIVINVNAQVSISNPATAPHASAMLEVKSTNRGFLMPRVALRTDVASPATGLLVYETASNAVWVYNGTTWVQLGSGGGVSQWLTNGTHIYNGNTGNVGIGITAPTAKLHLAGLLKIDGGQIDIDDNTAKIRLLYNGLPKGYFSITSSSGDIQIGTNIGSNDEGKIQLETKSSPRLTILPDGNVGIGTIVPGTKFHVVGSSKLEGVVTADQYVGLGNMLLLGTIVTNGNIQSNSSMSINNAAGTFQFQNGADEKGFVQLSGNNLRLGTNAANTTGKVVIRTGNDDQVFVDQDGKMGFDIAAPLAKIHIVAGDDAGLTTHGHLMIGDVTGSNIVMDNNEIIARGGNGTVGSLVLQNDGGTVRIGSVAVPSGYKFAINGKMLCEELRVKLSANWPDYVFSNEYKLMPLAELQKFIKTNNHLPNIPKASVIEKEGLEVGDMQKRLMEKVEELTLYILDLQKQIDELKTNHPVKN